MEITCYRNPEVSREPGQLAAATYNLAHTLLSRSATGNLFIPIRAMQYLAILDEEELVFLDGVHKCWIDVAWRHFRPQTRVSLADPVTYEAVYYSGNAKNIALRLQAELPRALHALENKSRIDAPARVFKFPAP